MVLTWCSAGCAHGALIPCAQNASTSEHCPRGPLHPGPPLTAQLAMRKAQAKTGHRPRPVVAHRRAALFAPGVRLGDLTVWTSRTSSFSATWRLSTAPVDRPNLPPKPKRFAVGPLCGLAPKQVAQALTALCALGSVSLRPRAEHRATRDLRRCAVSAGSLVTL